MSDGFELQYGLDPTSPADALIHSDGDDVINADEHVADTDPFDAFSYFHVWMQEPTGVRYHSSSNRLYSLEFRGALKSGAWSNVVGRQDMPGSGEI